MMKEERKEGEETRKQKKKDEMKETERTKA